MALAQQDLEIITEHIQKSFPILQEAPHSGAGQSGQNIYWLERSVKVEEELRNQRELLEKMMLQMDKRFEQVDKRFEAMQHQIDKRFEAMQHNMDKRFEQVDKHFEAMQSNIDKRFEQVDKRFEEMRADMDKRFRALYWMLTIGFTSIMGGLPLLLKYL